MATIEPYQLQDGKRYLVRYRKPDNSQTTKRGFKTKKSAELFKAKVEISIAQGDYIEPSSGALTVGELGVEWLARQTHLKPSTLRSIEGSWRTHVLPKWGSTPINKILPSEIQAWISKMSENRKATTVKRAHGILYGILKDATRDRRLSRNAAEGMKLPRKGKRRHKYLSHTQVKLLADCTATNRQTLLYVLAYAGPRWGEACGMRVSSLNTERKRLYIAENAVLVGGTIHLGTPKSHEFRWTPYPAFLNNDLVALTEGKEKSDLLFGDGKSHLRTPDNRNGWFKGALNRAQKLDPEFPTITIHDLRHTAASLAISAGANVKAVQNMLGHASAAMTLDTYSDLFDDDLDIVGVKLDEHRAAELCAQNVLKAKKSKKVKKQKQRKDAA